MRRRPGVSIRPTATGENVRRKENHSILSHRWLSPPAVLVPALRAWNKLRCNSIAAHWLFTNSTSPRGATLLLPGPTAPRAKVGEPFHPLSPVAVATGSSCAGPPGLEQGAMQLYRSSLAAYPQHQPRRGDVTLAGADSPTSESRRTVPSSLTGGCRHRQFLCWPSGPGASCDATLSQLTGCLPTTPAPEGRHYSCRGRQAPEAEGGKKFILSAEKNPMLPRGGAEGTGLEPATPYGALHFQ